MTAAAASCDHGRLARRVVQALVVVIGLGACADPAPERPTVDQPPVAVLAVPARAQVGEAVTVDGQASVDVDGEIAEAVLVFGDGSEPAFNLRADHAWAAPGLYTVELFVKDAQGLRGRARVRVEVVP